MDTSNNLQAEVAQLKHDLKRQRWTNVGLLMCGLLGAGALNARTQNAESTEPQDLIVRSLKVVGPNGAERISLKAGEHYGDIRITGPKREPQVVLSSNALGGAVYVSDNSGRPLSALHPGTINFVAKSEKHKKGRYLAVSIQASEEYSGLIVMDHAGNVLAEVPKSASK